MQLRVCVCLTQNTTLYIKGADLFRLDNALITTLASVCTFPAVFEQLCDCFSSLVCFSVLLLSLPRGII